MDVQSQSYNYKITFYMHDTYARYCGNSNVCYTNGVQVHELYQQHWFKSKVNDRIVSVLCAACYNNFSLIP